MKVRWCHWIAYAGLLIGCGSEAPAGRSEAAFRGERVYENVCIACHHRDPSLAGSLGPEIDGASRELLEAKVLHNRYPPGYTPRRPGSTMPQYGYLADSIDDLAAFLAAPGS